MMNKLRERFRAWARQSAAAFKERLSAAARRIRPIPPAVACVGICLGIPGRTIPDTGIAAQFRPVNGHPHCPVFSLFTFFADPR